MKETPKKDLVAIIKANPGCRAIIDNDCWSLHKAYPYNWDLMTDKERDKWRDTSELAYDGDVKPLGDGGYGSGCCYGGDILQALAIIVGINVESV